MALTEEYRVVIQNKLSTKLKDHDSFSIPCPIGNVSIDRALCDLGSSLSLMAFSLYKKLYLGEMRPIYISLQLENHSIKYPTGVLEDVHIKVEDLHVLVKFVILKMEEDMHTLITLWRPFLATSGCRINVKNDKLSFDLEFSLIKASKFPLSLVNVIGLM